jgi:hypothetical protein
MASDLQKTIAGGLLFGASLLTGNAVMATAAAGIGLNWASEGSGGLLSRIPRLFDGSSTALARAGTRAIRRAVDDLEEAYAQQYGDQADTRAFELVRDCADAVSTLDPLAPAGDAANTQQTLAAAFAELLHGHEQRQSDFIRAGLLPLVAERLRTELTSNDEARAEYQRLFIATAVSELARLQPHLAQLPEIREQLRDDATLRQNLTEAVAALQAEIEALRTQIAQRPAAPTTPHPVDLAVFDSAIARSGGSATVRNQRMPGEPRRSEGVSANQIYDGSAIAEGPGSQALVENRTGIGTPDPNPEPGRPPALVLTLQFTPTPTGARVRWSADEIGAFHSEFVAPYRGADLAAVLRGLERLQHPDFGLVDGDPDRLAALGLLTDDRSLPDDLPQRVGSTLFEALVSGDGIAALAWARGQATPTKRPLALRLLFPDDAIELAALPWELLWNPANPTTPMLLSATPSLLLTRHLDRSEPLPQHPPCAGRPLRILAITPHAQRTPAEFAQIETSLAALWGELQAQGVAEITSLNPATRSELASAMQQHTPDIVQFTGHGWYADGRGVLGFDASDPARSFDWIDADQMAVALRGARMVVLAACRSAQSAGIEESSAALLSGVAPALSAAGIPAVVGMQLGIRVDAALHACAAIYRSLATGLSAQAAVGRARDQLYVLEPDRTSWYVPTLYVRTREPEPVFV